MKRHIRAAIKKFYFTFKGKTMILENIIIKKILLKALTHKRIVILALGITIVYIFLYLLQGKYGELKFLQEIS